MVVTDLVLIVGNKDKMIKELRTMMRNFIINGVSQFSTS
jgi:hypothetical protein